MSIGRGVLDLTWFRTQTVLLRSKGSTFFKLAPLKRQPHASQPCTTKPIEQAKSSFYQKFQYEFSHVSLTLVGLPAHLSTNHYVQGAWDILIHLSPLVPPLELVAESIPSKQERRRGSSKEIWDRSLRSIQNCWHFPSWTQSWCHDTAFFILIQFSENSSASSFANSFSYSMLTSNMACLQGCLAFSPHSEISPA